MEVVPIVYPAKSENNLDCWGQAGTNVSTWWIDHDDPASRRVVILRWCGKAITIFLRLSWDAGVYRSHASLNSEKDFDWNNTGWNGWLTISIRFCRSQFDLSISIWSLDLNMISRSRSDLLISDPISWSWSDLSISIFCIQVGYRSRQTPGGTHLV